MVWQHVIGMVCVLFAVLSAIKAQGNKNTFKKFGKEKSRK